MGSTGMKWKPQMAAEMLSSIEISWRYGAFHGFFALKLIQVVGVCLVYSCCINIADLGSQRRI